MEFFKFPRTPHLFVLPGAYIRDDKMMSNAEEMEFLAQPIIVEEKVDGANIGISFNEKGDIQFQNRGNYIKPGDHPQFEPIWEWGYQRFDLLKRKLAQQYILFGEWCYVKHSIHYTELDDWFLGFDIFDRHVNRFLSVNSRNEVFKDCDISPIPLVFSGIITTSELLRLINNPSKFYDGPVEGLYLRLEETGYLKQRAKIIRSEFIQAIEEHWTKGPLIKNLCNPMHITYRV